MKRYADICKDSAGVREAGGNVTQEQPEHEKHRENIHTHQNNQTNKTKKAQKHKEDKEYKIQAMKTIFLVYKFVRNVQTKLFRVAIMAKSK